MIIPLDNAKQDVLRKAGLAYNFDLKSYVNRKTRLVISMEFAEANSLEEIRKVAEAPSVRTTWRIYFSRPPSDLVRAAIEEALSCGSY
jgi:hypothetical protein